jgi:hypothetical protein
MKTPDSDLLGSDKFLMAAICLALAAAALIISQASRTSAERRLAENNLGALRASATTIDLQRRTELRSKITSLEAQQIVGRESRLVFIENIEEAARRTRLEEVRYELLPQVPLSSIMPMTGATSVETSPMRLTLAVRNPEELSAFFRHLHSQPRGLFWIRGCSLHQQGDETTAGWRADCELLWLTVEIANVI